MNVEQLNSLLAPILPNLLPNLLLDEERDGEVIVYTGLQGGSRRHARGGHRMGLMTACVVRL
jgi:hypothetical protein